jgi:hypothetical protein
VTTNRIPARALGAILVLATTAAAPAALQSRDQRRCIEGLNAAATHMVAAVSANALFCLARATRGKLPQGESGQHCLAGDHRNRIAHAMAKTTKIQAARCKTLPDFGPTSADAVNAAVLGAPWTTQLFGADLDAALAAGASRCQRAVAGGVARLIAARLDAFDLCARTGLARGTITDGAGLAACYDDDRRHGVAKATVRVSRLVTSRCGAVTIASVFPGRCADVAGQALAACVSGRADCTACACVTGADALARTCHRFTNGVATTYCGAPIATTPSVARQWDQETLAAIRVDIPRPPIHARNLFHVSVAMWDAWAAYDPVARGYFVTDKVTSTNPAADRATTISFAAYRVLSARYAKSPNAAQSDAAFAARMEALGYDPSYTDATASNPAALGNRIGAAVLAATLGDGSNEAANYADPTYTPVNDPLVVKQPGTTMNDPNRWQPLALDVMIGQNGVPIPGKVQVFVGPQWGSVTPFAIDFATLVPGPPPRLHDVVTDADFKQAAATVIQRSSELTPDDGVTLDISPASYGNNPLGTNDGTGYATNPVTGQPYTPEVVKRGDFARVLAEYWADGPTSETPPGHWNLLANMVTDQLTERHIGGVGPAVDALEWDVKLYLALNGAEHDAAIGCWGTKRVYDSVRPISMIRYMGELGQSTDSGGQSYDADGLPLMPGLIEVVTSASSAPGERHQALADFVGEIALFSWPGGPNDPPTEHSGVRWVRAKTWNPYQRATFVTPAFAGYTSGHSTFSRAGAEVLTAITGSPYFPGGLGQFTAPANHFLQFEEGPSDTVVLEWASYYDAADQAGQSRIWGGIHITADDFGGREMGAVIGPLAWAKAQTYYAP